VKTLTPTELIELLPPNAAMVDAAMRQFELAAPVLCREPGYCRELISEGWTIPQQVNFRGRPAFLFTWHVTSDSGFWLDIVQTLRNGAPGAPFEVLVWAVEQFARAKGSRYIRFLTLRRGLVQLAQQQGYNPEAVLMTKLL
jgi:hypothetical protein